MQDAWTALHMASLKGHTAVVVLLLAKGADVDAMNTVRLDLSS